MQFGMFLAGLSFIAGGILQLQVNVIKKYFLLFI